MYIYFQILVRAMMIFFAPTIMYAFLWHITPFMLEDFGPWTIYYANVAVVFSIMNMVINWLATILYDPSYPKTSDNPFFQQQNQNNLPEYFQPLIELNQSQNNSNGHCVYDMTEKEALPWEYCEQCKMNIPPRAYHCKVCKKCVLKRDHHCYLVGNCVGFKNQRYFIVMNYYIMLVGLGGGAITYFYIQGAIWPELNGWYELLFPIAILSSFVGQIKVLHALVILQIYTEFFFGFIGFIYFSSQLTLSMSGITLYEAAKKIPIKNNNTAKRNLRSVFGQLWALNFIFPMTLVFRQTDDGIHWENVKIDHNYRKRQQISNQKETEKPKP